MKSRLKAFTILEIVVTIAITAILTTLVYGAINFLNAQNYREMRSKDRINEWMILRKQIIQDVYLSNSIEKIENGMKLNVDNNNIEYHTENGVLYIQKGESRIETSFNDATCTWSITEKDQEKCIWTIEVLDEPMKVEFYAFSTRADRINQWYELLEPIK